MLTIRREHLGLVQRGKKTLELFLAEGQQWGAGMAPVSRRPPVLSCPVEQGEQTEIVAVRYAESLINPGDPGDRRTRLVVSDREHTGLFADIKGFMRIKLSEVVGAQCATSLGYDNADELQSFLWARYRVGFASEPWVWLVEFTVVAAPRHLTSSQRHRGDDLGYSAKPDPNMGQEPEAVPEGVQERFSREGEAKDRVRAGERADDEFLAVRAQLDELRRWGGRNGIDVRSEVRVLERRLREKLRRRAA